MGNMNKLITILSLIISISTFELNQSSYLNDEELRSRLGLGVDGDYDEYQHLLKKVSTNPEKLERFLKFLIRNKMKAIKHDKKLRRIRFCKLEKNKQKEVYKN